MRISLFCLFGQPNLGRRRQRVRAPPLLHHHAPTVAAANPQLRGAVVAGLVVLQPIRPVVAQPGLPVKPAQQRVAVANVFQQAVVRANGQQLRRDLVPAQRIRRPLEI